MPRGGKRPGAGRRKKSDLSAALDGLKPRKQRYVANRLAGKTKMESALDAGYAPSVARNAAQRIETDDVRKVFQTLIRLFIPPELIARRIRQGLDAKETKFFQKDGKLVESREVIAWSERRQYAELAAELGGYHDSKRPPQDPPATESLIYRSLGPNPSARVVTVREMTEIKRISEMVVGEEKTTGPALPSTPIIVVEALDEPEDY